MLAAVFAFDHPQLLIGSHRIHIEFFAHCDKIGLRIVSWLVGGMNGQETDREYFGHAMRKA